MNKVRACIPALIEQGITVTESVNTVVVSKEISLGLQSIHARLHICRYSGFSFYGFRDVYLVPEVYRSVWTEVFDRDKYGIIPKVERAGYFTIERISAYAVEEGYYKPIGYRIAEHLKAALGKAASAISKYCLREGITPKEISDWGVLQYALVCVSEDRVCCRRYYDLMVESDISKVEDFERILREYFGRAAVLTLKEGTAAKCFVRNILVRDYEMSTFKDRMDELIKRLSEIR